MSAAVEQLQPQQVVADIPLGRLIPREDQPRQHFGEESLRELADSMVAKGFLRGNAITVRPAPEKQGRYEILAGHRRVRAAKLARIEQVPAIVADMGDAEAREFVLLDNLNREDFLCWEEGAGYAELVASGLAVEQVAGRAGKSVGYVTGRIAIHEGLGMVARAAWLAGEVKQIGVLAMLAEVPDEELVVCKCACGITNPDERDRRVQKDSRGVPLCLACRAPLKDVVRVSGNPQAAATRLCREKDMGQAREIIVRVRESYGIGDAPVQASLALTFEDERLSPEVLAVRSRLERRLAEIGQALGGLLKDAGMLQELTGDGKASVVAQCEVGIRALQGIQREVTA